MLHKLYQRLIDLPQEISLTIRWYLLTGIFWLFVSSIVAVLARLHLFMPAFMPGIIDYGHLRPIYTAILIFGGLLSLFAGLSYFILKSEGYRFAKPITHLAFIGFQLHQLALLAGIAGILLGLNKGREYGEFVWIADPVLFLSLGIFCINIILALRQQRLTVKGALMTTAAVGSLICYFIGNFGLPYDLLASSPLFTGLQDSTLQGIYRSGLWSYLIMLPLLVLLYHFLPHYYKVSLYNESVVYSLLVAVVILTPLSGAIDLIFSAAPAGLQTVGVVSFMALNFALLIAGLNADFGLRYSGRSFRSNALGFMLRSGLFFLIMALLFRALLAPRFMQAWAGLSALNIRDLAIPVHTYGLLIGVSCSAMALQSLNGRKFAPRLMAPLLTLFVPGIIFIYTSNFISSLLHYSGMTAVQEEGTLAVKEWSEIFFAGSLYDGKEPYLRFLLGLGGLNLLGYLLLLAAMLLFFLRFLPAAISRNSVPKEEPSAQSVPEVKG